MLRLAAIWVPVLWFCGWLTLVPLWSQTAEPAAQPSLDPRGRLHLPIGIPNTVDQLKTFVEAEGSFSPGFGSFGVYFWLWDPGAGELWAPTLRSTNCDYGLAAEGALIPWSRWSARGVEVTTEVCQVQRTLPDGQPLQLVGARVRLLNHGLDPIPLSVIVAVRGLGPAGGPIRRLEAAADALSMDGREVLVAEVKPDAIGVDARDAVPDLALAGKVPSASRAESPTADASGALKYDFRLGPSGRRTFGFICPVHPGRRVSGHRWDGVNAWAQLDLARVDDPAGALQPVAPPAFLRRASVDALFREAKDYWRTLTGRCLLKLPDPRWSEAFAAILAHSALNLNDGAPDVAVVNYNVFNRDGMYLANIFQKAGVFELAESAIDYFLGHPFNGRVQPEADNPGQVLFILGEHWRFTRNRTWLERVYPAVRKLTAMIRYYRTTPGPHWVWDQSLEFGDALPADQRKELKPGACDGHNPNYTEAYDVAGLRAAVTLAEALGQTAEAREWQRVADELFHKYEQQFESDLTRGYGSYAVLWPCRLYPLTESKGQRQFREIGAQALADWRYFPLARAHQGLLAGNRAAGWQTLDAHLQQESMHGWYALDEGGPAGVGGWLGARSTWPIQPLPWDTNVLGTIAMPHGWSGAEFHLLLRDCLVFEDGDCLVLFAGVPPEWFTDLSGIRWSNLPTHFGLSAASYQPTEQGGLLRLGGTARPTGGFRLRIPTSPASRVIADRKETTRQPNGDYLLPPMTRVVRILTPSDGFR